MCFHLKLVQVTFLCMLYGAVGSNEHMGTDSAFE